MSDSSLLTPNNFNIFAESLNNNYSGSQLSTSIASGTAQTIFTLPPLPSNNAAYSIQFYITGAISDGTNYGSYYIALFTVNSGTISSLGILASDGSSSITNNVTPSITNNQIIIKASDATRSINWNTIYNFSYAHY